MIIVKKDGHSYSSSGKDKEKKDTNFLMSLKNVTRTPNNVAAITEKERCPVSRP